MGYPVIILSFDYSGIKISPDDKQEYFTEFRNNDGEFIIPEVQAQFPLGGPVASIS
jgi:hypothetical protein